MVKSHTLFPVLLDLLGICAFEVTIAEVLRLYFIIIRNEDIRRQWRC